MDYSKNGNAKKEKHIRSKAVKARKKAGFNIFRCIIFCIVVVLIMGVAAGIGGLKGVIDSAPVITAADVSPNKLKSVMYYSDGTVAAELVGSQSNRTIKTIDEIPDNLENAFISIEDERFREHNGIDPKGIARAAVVGIGNLIKGGGFSEGASTLTQQLIKLTIFNGGAETNSIDRFKRKFQEQYMALQLEKIMTKDEILEAYMNTINLGRGAYGVEAAAQRYFNKSCEELTVSECAVIAGIAQSPSYNNPIDGQQTNSERRIKILNNMLKENYITQAEYDEAMADDVYSRILEVNDAIETDEDINSYFVDAAITDVIKDLQEQLGYTKDEATTAVYSGGLQIELTQDKNIQEICDSYFRDNSNFSVTEYYLNYRLTVTDENGNNVNLDQTDVQDYFGKDNCDLLYDTEDQARAAVAEYKEANGYTDANTVAETWNITPEVQSSFVLMDQSTGQVLALVGGRGEKTTNRGFNRAVDATRQPGSVFKPISTFLPALDACDLTLASTKMDEPYTTPRGAQVYNTNANSYSGLSTMRQAIVNSMNIVTTRFLVEDVTATLGLEYLKKLGITTLDEVNDNNDVLGLGGITNGVNNLELTAAYATIANGGVYNEPVLYTRILDKDGNVLLENIPETRTVMKASTAWLLTNAMEDVVSYGTGTAAKISNYGIAEAGKTGTTNEYKDLWFVGYTPYYTAGIWMGYDDSTSMRGRIASYSEHKVLWKNIMNKVLEGLDNADFEIPDGIVKATVCKSTGLLAHSGCNAVTEYFAADNVPTSYCTYHSYYTPPATNASTGTPGETAESGSGTGGGTTDTSGGGTGGNTGGDTGGGDTTGGGTDGTVTE